MTKHSLQYTNCWEDGYLLDKSLQVNSDSILLSIASGGDNTLLLLKNNPKQLICVDSNPLQIYCTELKARSVEFLTKERHLQFCGYIDDTAENRMKTFEFLSPFLNPEVFEFWENYPKEIERGFIHMGKFEKYLQLFANRCLPLVHSKSTCNKLIAPKPEEQQIKFYNKKWNSWAWKLLFRAYFNQKTMSKLGRDEEKFAHSKTSMLEQIWKKTDYHLQSTLCQNNYILDYILFGKYKQHVPPYLNHFEKIKKWIKNNGIEYYTGDFQKAMQLNKGVNRMNLSDVFEYMDEKQFRQCKSLLRHNTETGTLISFWNFLVPRSLDTEHFKIHTAQIHDDRGFYHQQFYCYQTKPI